MLTEIAVRNLKAKPVRYEKPDGKGLFVAVHPTGKKSYVVRFRVDGKPKKLTLPQGKTLAEARAEAAAAVLKPRRGSDCHEAQGEGSAADRPREHAPVHLRIVSGAGGEEEGWRPAAEP